MRPNSKISIDDLNELARKVLNGDLVAKKRLLKLLNTTKIARQFVANFEDEHSGWASKNNKSVRTGKYYQSTIVALSGKTSARSWKTTK